MRPSVGVLIPYFNEASLFRENLDSLLSQEVKPDEILIYDDASDVPPDPYVPKGLPVQILRGQVNRGPSYSRNVLSRTSRSDYIHFQDADDLFQPAWCRRVREAIDQTGAEAIFTEMTLLEGHQVILERAAALNELAETKNLANFCFQCMLPLQAMTVRREVIDRIGGFRESLRLSEDWDYQARLGVSGIRFAIVEEPLILKRRRSGSLSADLLPCLISSRQAIQFLSEELPPQYRSDLAEAAAYNGSALFQMGAWEEAKKSWRLAHQLGPPTFSRFRWRYRALARSFGPEAAENIGALYRRIIPEGLRRIFAKRSS